MIVTLLGTGTPWPDLNRHGPAVLLRVGTDNILFDTGRGVVYQALKADVRPSTINPIFLTHLHFDHISDLFDVVLSSWTDNRTHVLKIFGPSGTSEIVSALVDQVYWKDIKFRVAECAASENVPLNGSNITRLEVKDVGAGLVYETDHYQVWAEFVQHNYDAEQPDFDWSCLGYRITSQNKSVVISGDTIACEGLDRLARGADLLVHCCIRAEKDVHNPQQAHLTKYVLPSAMQVGKIAASKGVPRLAITHISNSASLQDMVSDIREEFSGELIMGEDLLEIEV